MSIYDGRHLPNCSPPPRDHGPSENSIFQMHKVKRLPRIAVALGVLIIQFSPCRLWLVIQVHEGRAQIISLSSSAELCRGVAALLVLLPARVA